MLAIGISGGTASGKSTLAASLAEAFRVRGGFDAEILSQDDYCLGIERASAISPNCPTFDHPEVSDLDRLANDIASLRAGKTIEAPEYDFKVHRPKATCRQVKPKPILIVEGLFLFTHPALSSVFDLRIFVSEADDVRLARRLLRDSKRSDRSTVEALQYYLSSVRPGHNAFVEPSRSLADLIISSQSFEPFIGFLCKIVSLRQADG